MTHMTRWLAAVAGVALVTGTPIGLGVPAEAATTARPAAHAKAKAKKRVVRRRPVRSRTAAVARPERQPDGDSAQIARTPRPAGAETPALVTPVPPVYVPVPPPVENDPYLRPAPDPAPAYADYRWLDDADAMIATIGASAPDRVFAENRRDARYFWQLNDGAIIIAEPLPNGDRRWYFYERDTTVPFLVRTPDDSYAYERGRLAVVYDGAAQRWRPGDRQEREAADLFDRGRQLWFAARAPAPLPPRAQLSDWSLFFDWGADWRGWRENDGWRAWRRGPGYDHRRALDDRYRRERADRAARAARGDGWNGYGAGGPQPGGSPPPRSGQAGPGQFRPDRPGRGSAPVAAPPVPVPPASPIARSPREVDAPIGDTPRVPPGNPSAFERGPGEPTGERPTRRPSRSEAEAPVTEAPAMAPERAPRMREPEAAPAPAQPAVAAPAPEPAPAPRAEPRPEPTPPPPTAAPPVPEAPPPPRAAPPPEPAAPPAPAPAPPPAEPERAPRTQHENERPE